MHEYLTAVVTGEKAIPLVGVVPLDLAGRHAQTSRRRELKNNQRSGDRQDAMGTSKAIGPGRRIAAWYRRLPAADRPVRDPWPPRAACVSPGHRVLRVCVGSLGSGLTRINGAGTGLRARPESEGDLSPVIKDRNRPIPSTYIQ